MACGEDIKGRNNFKSPAEIITSIFTGALYPTTALVLQQGYIDVAIKQHKFRSMENRVSMFVSVQCMKILKILACPLLYCLSRQNMITGKSVPRSN